MAQPPQKPPTTPADVINIAYVCSMAYAMCFWPFMRSKNGDRALTCLPFTFVMLLGFATTSPMTAMYLPVWILRVVWMRIFPDRLQHSRFTGWPILTKLRLSYKNARTLELPCVFFAGIFLFRYDPIFAQLLSYSSFAMGIVWGAELEMDRAAVRRNADARIEMEYERRIQGGGF